MTASKNHKKVLIVEDDDLMLGVLSQQFLDHGFDVVTAVDGVHGIDQFYKEAPDVVVLDIVMPRKDGIQMLDDIHKKTPDNKTPIFVLSNSSDMNHIASATSHNVIAYLIKSEQEIQGIVSIVKKHMGIA